MKHETSAQKARLYGRFGTPAFSFSAYPFLTHLLMAVSDETIRAYLGAEKLPKT